MTQTAAKPQLETEAEIQLTEEAYALGRRARREAWFTNLRLVWLKRRLVLRFTFVGLLFATVFAFLTPKRYVATTQLMPPDSQSSGTMALASALAAQSGSLGSLAGEVLGVKSTGALFIGVLRSRTVEDGVANRFDLGKIYGTRAAWATRQVLDLNTAISEDRKSGIITLAVTDLDPKRATAMAGAYVEQLDAIVTQLTTSSAHRERVFLEERLTAVKQDLESAEKNFSQFANRSGAIDISAQGKAAVEGAARLEGQLIAAQSELQGLKQLYTDNNIRVEATQARVSELRHQLEKLSGTGQAAPPQGEQVPSEALYPSLRQLPLLGVPFADLYRRLKVEEVVYETLTKQYELAKVQEAKELPTVRVLDAPEIPEKKSYPPRLQFMMLGTLLGAMLGMAWVLVKARWQAIAVDDPGKQLALEIFQGVRARIPWSASNGSQNGTGLSESTPDSDHGGVSVGGS